MLNKVQNKMILPTELVIRSLIADTNWFIEQHGLQEWGTITVDEAVELVVCAIRDVLYEKSAVTRSVETADKFLAKKFPWYSDANLSLEYFSIFDKLFYPLELNLKDMMSHNAYDVWDIRPLRHLSTLVSYKGDHRIIEWERMNSGVIEGDLYVGDEDYPRLYGSLVAMGHYLCIKTNRVIENLRDVSDEIIDWHGVVVIRTEDLALGLTVK